MKQSILSASVVALLLVPSVYACTLTGVDFGGDAGGADASNTMDVGSTQSNDATADAFVAPDAQTTVDAGPLPRTPSSTVLRTEPGIRSVVARANRLYLATGVGPGGRPWESGTLYECNEAACTGTLTVVPKGDLHFPVLFGVAGDRVYAFGHAQPMETNSPLATDALGDVLRLDGNSAPTNLGFAFNGIAPAAYAGPGVRFFSLVGNANVIATQSTSYHNHGCYTGVDVWDLASGTPMAIGHQSGSEVDCVKPLATPTRLFLANTYPGYVAVAHGPGAGGGAYVAANPSQQGIFRTYFAFGERLGIIRQSIGAASEIAICESDSSCNQPTLHPGPTFANEVFVGTADDQLIWYVNDQAGNVTFRACSLAEITSNTCLTGAVIATTPEPSLDVTLFGRNMYFADNNGAIRRVGL